jgi:hypothetical protein
MKKDNFQKLEDERSKFKVTCKCGTKTILVDADYTICRGCHNYVFKNPKIEFEFRIKEKMLK